MRSRRNASNGWPAARAISTPSTSEPVWYSQRSPGWCISGSVPRRCIEFVGRDVGWDGPRRQARIAPIAFWIGYVAGTP